MDKAEKRRFIEDLCDSIKQTVVDSIPKMPEAWDGIELRQLIADKANESTAFDHRPDMRRRAKDYRNEIIVRNL